MSEFDIALVAYAPDGAKLGPLPAPSRITSATSPLNDIPILSFDYLQTAPGAQHLGGPVEIAVNVFNPSTGEWIEPANGRYLLLDWDSNDMEQSGRRTYACPGYGQLLDKISTRPRTSGEKAEAVAQAQANATAAKAAYNAANTALRTAATVSQKVTPIFAGYQPDVVNGGLFIDIDQSPMKVWKGTRTKGTEGTWADITTTARSNAAAAAYEAKLTYDDANAGITRAKNDTTFDREIVNASAGKVMKQLIDEGKARGDRIPGLTYDFTNTVDSNGVGWAMTFEEPLVIRAGMSALDVLMTLVDQGLCDWEMEGRVLHLYNVDTVLKRDRTSYKLLAGTDISDAPDKGTYNSLTHNVLFLGEAGLTFEMSNNAPITPWGKWEKSVSQGGVTSRSTGQALGQAELDAGAGPRSESTRELIFQDNRPLPYIHYRVGDEIKSIGPTGTEETLRVRQITLSREPDGTPKGNIVLGDRFLERELRNSRTLDGLLGGATPKGNGAPPGTPTVPSERRPEAPRDLTALAQNYSDSNGKVIGRLLVDWEWDGTDTNGTPIEDNGYQVQIRPDHLGEPWASAKNTPLNTLTLDDVRVRTEGGAVEVYQLRVRTIAYNGRASDWSDVVSVMMEADITPPPVPSALVGEANYGAVTAFWDGLGAGGESMPTDFKAVEGEIASAIGGPYKLFAGYPYRGGMDVPWQLDYGQYWLRARSVDWSGNYSAYSEISTVTTTPLVDLPDVHDMIDEFNQKWADAMEGVGIAQDSANGKNRVRYSTSLPTIVGGEIEGDVWWRFSNSSMTVLIGTWIFSAGAWKPHTFGHMTMDSIDLAKATIGKLNGAFIEVKSLNASHINVGDFTNLTTIDPEVPVNVTTPAAFATVAAGGYTYKADGGSDYLMFLNQTAPVPFKSGDWIRVSFDAMATTEVSVPTVAYFYPNRTGTSGGVSSAGTSVLVTPTETHYSFDIQVPDLGPISGGKSWTMGLAGPNARAVGVRNVTAYKKVDATTIAPDSIRTPMLGADIIESKHIKSNTIETDNMVGGFADFIVITGSTLQTLAAANAGIKLLGSTNRMVAFNDVGEQTFNLNGDDGDIWVGKNGTFRVWGDSGDLSIGNGKFIVDGSTGNVEMSDAKLTAGRVEGATITGGSVTMTGDGTGDYTIGLRGSSDGGYLAFWIPETDTEPDIGGTIRGYTVQPTGYDTHRDGAGEMAFRSPSLAGYAEERGAMWLQGSTVDNGQFEQPALLVRGDVTFTGAAAVYSRFGMVIDSAPASVLDLGRFTTSVRSTPIRDNPYTFAANMYVTSNGYIGQTSSAARFKLDAQEMELSDELLEITVMDWFDRTSKEEELRLAFLGVRDRDQQAEFEARTPEPRVPGVIAEDVAAATGGESFVSRNADGELQSVSYDRLAIAQIAVLKRQLEEERSRSDALEARLNALEEKLENL